MTRFRVVLEYDGTLYHGWQFQKGLATVQGKVEETLERILGAPVRVYGSGRTDAGVHAEGQVAHFTADWAHGPDDLHRACNALLPPDISVSALAPVADDFHARHSATAKTYRYCILNRPFRSALLHSRTWHVPFELDLSMMSEAARLLVGTHDFAAFGSATDGTGSTVRRIPEARWVRDNAREMLFFSVRGTGFLRYMVRCLVGTMVPVGRGKITPEDFRQILESRDRGRSGPSAPPQGLCLESVEYRAADGTIWSSGRKPAPVAL
jgi:tRNA pseudouridine38-40 synthase